MTVRLRRPRLSGTQSDGNRSGVAAVTGPGKDGSTSMGENPDKIKTDIEATRSRLTEELGLLSEKISPGQVAGRAAEDAKSAVAHARKRVASGTAGARVRFAGAAEELAPKASATAHKASVTAHKAKQTADEVVHRASQNPQITATARKVRESTGQAVRTTRRRATDNPGTTRAVAVGAVGAAATIAAVTVMVRRRRRRSRGE